MRIVAGPPSLCSSSIIICISPTRGWTHGGCGGSCRIQNIPHTPHCTCLAQVAWSSLADVCMAAVTMEGTLLPHRRKVLSAKWRRRKAA